MKTQQRVRLIVEVNRDPATAPDLHITPEQHRDHLQNYLDTYMSAHAPVVVTIEDEEED